MASFLIPAALTTLSFLSKKFEKKPSSKQYPSMSKTQQSFQDSLLSLLQGQMGQGQQTFQSGQNYLQNLLSGSPESQQAFEAPHMRQFQEQTIPGLAERFSGMGAGAQSSSAFQQALGQAGAGLQEQLAALRGGLQQSALPYALQSSFAPLQQLGGLGLGSRFSTGLQPGSPGGLAEFLAPLLQAYGGSLGSSIGQMGNLSQSFGQQKSPWQSTYGGAAQSRSMGPGMAYTKFGG